MKKLFPLIAVLTLTTVLLSSCNAINSLTSKINNGDAGNIATVNKIYAEYTPWAGFQSGDIAVDLTPTKQAVANTVYIVQLYEKGNLRDITTIVWNAPQINIATTLTVKFPGTAQEGAAYEGKDISGIFSVKVVQNNTTTNVITNTPTKNTTATTKSNIAVVAQILVGYSSDLGYYISAIIRPTELAQSNTNYTVTLYENGKYRATSSFYWGSFIGTKIVTFPCSESEYQKYYGQSDISNIFSVQITQ